MPRVHVMAIESGVYLVFAQQGTYLNVPAREIVFGVFGRVCCVMLMSFPLCRCCTRRR